MLQERMGLCLALVETTYLSEPIISLYFKFIDVLHLANILNTPTYMLLLVLRVGYVLPHVFANLLDTPRI